MSFSASFADFRVLRNRVAVGAQFRDGFLQLRHRGRDVRELDDVRLRLERERAEFREVVGDALLRLQEFREDGEDARGDGDVARPDVDARVFGEGLHDRQERVGGEGGRLVGLGVNDGRVHGVVGKRGRIKPPGFRRSKANRRAKGRGFDRRVESRRARYPARRLQSPAQANRSGLETPRRLHA